MPSDDEWELAARAGTTTAYPFAGGAAALGQYAWFQDNSGNATHEVRQLKPNAFGLYDLLGNVWEWTCSIKRDAMDAVVRGGSYGSPANDLRSAVRHSRPNVQRMGNVGFRLVRTL